MHWGESAPPAAFALHDHAKQEKPTHAQSAREKEIQSIPEAAYSPSGNEVNQPCSPKLPSAVPPFDARIAPCRDDESTLRSKRLITKTRMCWKNLSPRAAKFSRAASPACLRICIAESPARSSAAAPSSWWSKGRHASGVKTRRRSVTCLNARFEPSAFEHLC